MASILTRLRGSEHRNVYLLSVCQALLFTQAATLSSVGSLVGFHLADDKSLATLPAAAFVLGGAFSSMPASLWMRHVGRRDGFLSGAGLGVLGGLLAAAAVASSSFILLCIGMALLGVYNAFGQYYRFAAADLATPDHRPRAISLVLLGGIVGGIVGPELSKLTTDMAPTRFVATYASLVVVALGAMVVIRLLAPVEPADQQSVSTPQSLSSIASQPEFLLAVVVGTLGYAAMNLLMTATPLAMASCGHGYSASALAIQVHVTSMFAPSFFTGALIARFGEARIIRAGVAVFLFSVATGISGTTTLHFVIALALLGVGWNFTYVAASSLLACSCAVANRAKAQGLNETALVIGQTLSAIASGAILHHGGWQVLNLTALVLILGIGAASIELSSRSHGSQTGTRVPEQAQA